MLEHRSHYLICSFIFVYCILFFGPGLDNTILSQIQMDYYYSTSPSLFSKMFGAVSIVPNTTGIVVNRFLKFVFF